MEKRQVSVFDKSFDRAGITKDKEEAICEYIWNGFEAHANHVSVELLGGNMEEAPYIRVTDSGIGIPFETLESTFGAFLSSAKPLSTIRIKSQINKGKGRFSYLAFSNEAIWKTTYSLDNCNYEYTIRLQATERNFYEVSERNVVQKQTGTTVEIPLSSSTDNTILAYDHIKKRLLEEFAWYLYLNKDVKLDYCGTILHPEEYIDSELSESTTLKIGDACFTITIVVWKDKTANSSKIYYLLNDNTIVNAVNTTFNNNSAGFYHAVFVKSDFFRTVYPEMSELENVSYAETNPGERKILLDIKKRVARLIDATFHDFLARKANSRLKEIEMKGYFPKFSDDDFGKIKKKDFKRVAQELYCVEPKIFHKLKEMQCKSLLGFLNLLLQSDERENLLTIVDNIVQLSSDDRARFANILQRSKLEHIIDTIDLVQKRYEVVEALRSIVYDHARFANERDHVQKIIEQHYWLFGDEYYLMTADKTIKRSLEKHEEMLLTPVSDNNTQLTPEEQRRRMDIFLYSSCLTDSGRKEALVVELKAPSIPLTRTVYKQIEDYAYIVRKEKGFQAQDRVWRFYAVCGTVDEEVQMQYKNFEQHGRKCLAGIVGNFEIYALSWDDVFTSFELRHRFLLNKLRVDYENTASEMENDDSIAEVSRVEIDRRARKLIDMQLLPAVQK